MRLATLKDGTKDGHLMLVSRDEQRWVSARPVAMSLLDALERWNEVTPGLQARAALLEPGTMTADGANVLQAMDPTQCAAPLPRAPQWCDASAFLNHGRLMERAFKTAPIPEFETVPVMYQGASDDFLGACDDVALPAVADGIDFEGEFGVVVGDVAMGSSADECLSAIRLIVQINDWSLRALGPREMRSGFGFLQAKPSTSFAPIAVTPDELGSAWSGGRVHMQLEVDWNGQRFGQPSASEMNFDFGHLIAHAARTRRLRAGTIIGSGTVSNQARSAGSACIAERRVIEMIDRGSAVTPFMAFGDRVRMQARFSDGRPGPFGVIDQRVIEGRQ